MRKQLLSLLAVLICGVLLVACGGSSHNRSQPDTTERTQIASSDIKNTTKVPATTLPGQTYVYPAVGTVTGVVMHGITATSTHTGSGISYTCATPYHTFTVQPNHTVAYNGVQVQFTVNTTDNVNIHQAIASDEQASMYFTSATASFGAASLIVRPKDFVTVNNNNVPYIEDESVVNLTPAMVHTGIDLDSNDFASVTGFGSVTICVRS